MEKKTVNILGTECDADYDDFKAHARAAVTQMSAENAEY